MDDPSALDFSVVILLPGERGMLPECLARWAGQDYPRGRYEVLGVTDGADPALDRQVLASPDRPERVLSEPGAHRSRLYDLGARAARGRFVVFTESHCIAERDFLTEMDRCLRAGGYDGACCGTEPICPDNLALMDYRLFDEGFREFRKEGDWRKFNVHGVAVRRDAYLEAGGLEHRYGLFAEMLLAARLRDLGFRLGYAERARVRHNYRAGLREVIAYLEDAVTGECGYRHDHPGPDAVGHSFLMPPRPQDGDSALLGMLLKTLTIEMIRKGTPGARRGVGPACSGVSPTLFWRALGWTLGSGRRGRWLSQLALAKTALACLFWRSHLPRLEPAYRRLCEATARRAYLRWRGRNPARSGLGAFAPGLPWTRWPIAEIPEDDLVGFHGLETWQGEPFRWTGPAAALRVPLSPEDGEIVLETRGLRPDLGVCGLTAYCNGRRLPPSGVIVEAEQVRLRVLDACRASGATVELALTCTPIRPWTQGVADQRELGVPIFAIQGAAVGEAADAAHDQLAEQAAL